MQEMSDRREVSSGAARWPRRRVEVSAANPLAHLPRSEAVERREPASVGLREQALRAIRGRLVSGELGIGELRRETDVRPVASSRTPVREALAILAAEGLIDLIPQRGFVVREVTADEVSEILEMRTDFEARAVERLATGAGTVANISETERALEDMRNRAEAHDTMGFGVHEIDFHVGLASAAGFGYAAHTLTRWLTRIRIYRIARPLDDFQMPAIIEEHQTILGAVATRDTRQARVAVLRHMRATRERLDLARDPRVELELAGTPQVRR